MRDSRLAGALIFSFAIGAIVAGCVAPAIRPQDAEVAALASASMRKFANMEEFEAYRARVRALAKSRGAYGSRLGPLSTDGILLAQNTPEPCDPTVMDCGDKKLDEVVMTGSRARQSQSITNNQEIDVDEGDIVKQFGRFLVVLKDGRLFTIDMGTQAAELRLVDRINLYSSSDAGTWYDELLIHENTLVVTGYNYDEDASEINVLSIDNNGGLDLRARYFLQSEDYYSGSNYASRLVRGQFVLYTPVDISGTGALEIPRIRSWTAASGYSDWKPLFDITDVYLPIQETLSPTIHVISVCSISGIAPFACKSRGIVGPYWREVYVSSENVFVWLTSDSWDWAFGRHGPDSCEDGSDAYDHVPLSAAAFQLPLRTDGIRAIHTIGTPSDQFAFDERKGKLLALLERQPGDCYPEDESPRIFAEIPLVLFAESPPVLAQSNFTRVPETSGYDLQERYTSDFLVYASSEAYWWLPNEEHTPPDIVVVPVEAPSQFTVLHPKHDVERLELIGENVVAFGPADNSSLGISTLELRTGAARIADTGVMADLMESEGRSHAFNANISENGSGLFGLPTVYQSEYKRSRQIAADVQFFALNRALRIRPIGELTGIDYVSNDGYTCEVSCYDWYGDARPIFINGRIFALTGSELVEGVLQGGIMAEIGRLRMTGTPARMH